MIGAFSSLGEDNVALLKKKKVAVFGLGGVGGTCFEALLRSGVGHIYAIDRDVVDESNLNRQILFTSENVGSKKAGAAFLRAKSIRLDVEVLPECYSVSEDALKEHNYARCDFSSMRWMISRQKWRSSIMRWIIRFLY
jgi:tRNA A37 threonylcarbamoyladenosine dehydratase